MTTHRTPLPKTVWRMGDLANVKHAASFRNPCPAGVVTPGHAQIRPRPILAPFSKKYVIVAPINPLLGDSSRALRSSRAPPQWTGERRWLAGLGVVCVPAWRCGSGARTRSCRSDRSRTRLMVRALESDRVRVALDAQLAVGTATGIGDYQRDLAARLRRDPDVDLASFRAPRSVALRPARRCGIRCCCRGAPRAARRHVALRVGNDAAHVRRAGRRHRARHGVAARAGAHARLRPRPTSGVFRSTAIASAARSSADSAFSRGEFLEARRGRRRPRARRYPGVDGDFAAIERRRRDARATASSEPSNAARTSCARSSCSRRVPARASWPSGRRRRISTSAPRIAANSASANG